MTSKKGLLQRLEEGVVIGDGGFTMQLEKRGYVFGGAYTPEVVVERPEAVVNLHREFLDAGSDVMQAFTFYASEDKLSFKGNKSAEKYTCKGINSAACALAHRVAAEGDALVAAGVSQTPSYSQGLGKKVVQAEFQTQVDVFVENKVDFLVCEFFFHVEEIVWAIEVCKGSGLPVVASMAIGPDGDVDGVSIGECAVRMARAGASVVGVNCQFDYRVALQCVRLMKKALDSAGLKAHLITQPVGFHTPDAPSEGYSYLPEYPFALEPRICTRFDMFHYAREAYDLGVRYIGGCCGFEAYHIRSLTEELEKERGKPKTHSATKNIPWGGGLMMSGMKEMQQRANREHWENLEPATGRLLSASTSVPVNKRKNTSASSPKPT